jgi:hypothetical protein
MRVYSGLAEVVSGTSRKPQNRTGRKRVHASFMAENDDGLRITWPHRQNRYISAMR